MNQLLIKAFIYILIASVLWSHFADASLPNLLEQGFKYGSVAALLMLGLLTAKGRLHLDHLKAPLARENRCYWLSIFNKWACLLLITIALQVSTIKLENTEAYYQRLTAMHIGLALTLALCAIPMQRRIDRFANGFILIFSCILGHQLYLTWKEPAAGEAILLQAPFDREFAIMSGGYSILNSVLQSNSRSARAFGVHMRPSDSRYLEASEVERPFPHAFGATILSPANGTIVHANENIPDLPMGQMQPDTGPGNFILLQIAPEVFLIFANLQQNSIRPEVGDTVSAGEPIAAIGKSGMFTEPVLLLIATNTTDIFGPDAHSLPIVFEGVEQVDAPRATAPFFPTRNDHYRPLAPTKEPR